MSHEILVDQDGNIYLPISVSIPRDAKLYQVDYLPDIDTHLYINNHFVRKPDADRIESEMNIIAEHELGKKAIEMRKKAYVSESDPLYMEWQYDQTPGKEQAWRDKVAEIKARYPLPSEA